MSCSGSFFYPELAGRRGRRPAGWQPALADGGVDFSGLPTDRPVNFDDIKAFELRNAGRVEVFVFVWQQTLWTDGMERAPSGTGVVRHTVLLLLHSLITPTNTGGCAEHKCPRCMARFTARASWQRHRATQCYREIAERTRKVPLPGPAALAGQGLRRARAPDVLRGPRGLQHARPDGPRSAAAAGAPDRRGFFLLRRRRPLRLRAARGAEAEAHAPRAGQRQVPRRPPCWTTFSSWPTTTSPGDAELGPSA